MFFQIFFNGDFAMPLQLQQLQALEDEDGKSPSAETPELKHLWRMSVVRMIKPAGENATCTNLCIQDYPSVLIWIELKDNER